MGASVPPGLKLLSRLFNLNSKSEESKFRAYKASVLLLTFVAYALFHASRKPPSIVKNVLHSDDALTSPGSGNFVSLPWPIHRVFVRRAPTQTTQSLGSGWAPFDGDSGTTLLGQVDVAFLASYSIGMYFAGHLGDRLCLRTFLASGMVGSGVFVCLFGLAYWWNVHWLAYFMIVQILGGLLQATGWPSVVTVVSKWFGKKKRGLIMGVWNAHTSVGNICGSLMASAVLSYGWGWCFTVPGVAIIAGGVVVYLFLVVDPETVELPSPYENHEDSFSFLMDDEEKYVSEVGTKVSHDSKGGSMTKPLLRKGAKEEDDGESSAVGFLQAWSIPRVAPFALCLFFAKLVAYTFLYWLPFYIRHTEIQGEYLSDSTAGNLSTIFDVGGTLGGILAGYLSDRLNARAIVAASFTYAALPALLFYRIFGGSAFWLNVVLLFVAGMFVNGPYALITTAVSADLGTHKSLKGNARALATVTAIIDGTGSVGAALGPLLTGYLSKWGWNSVFALLMLSAATSGLLLTRLVVEEWKEYMTSWKLGRVRQVSLL